MILKKTFGIQNERSIGVRASDNKNPESENDDNLLSASKLKGLKHPAKLLYQNELNLEGEKIASEADYHNIKIQNTVLLVSLYSRGLCRTQFVCIHIPVRDRTVTISIKNTSFSFTESLMTQLILVVRPTQAPDL